MRGWGRRIRAAIGVGLTWGAAWLAVGLVLLAIVGPHAADVPFPLFFGLLGFLAGAAFSGLLGMIGSRRKFEEQSMGRFAGWGALGGTLVALLVNWAAGPSGDMLMLVPLFAAASATCAMGTLVLARRAERQVLVEGERGDAVRGPSSRRLRDVDR
jgi:hypothetical protein